MSKKRASLEVSNASYQQLREQSLAAVCEKRYSDAIDLAIRSLEYVDDMMRFMDKHRKISLSSVETIELAIRYAPPMLASKQLDAIDDFLRSRRAIKRQVLDETLARVNHAKDLVHVAYVLWSYVEDHAPCCYEDAVACVSDRTFDAMRLLDDWVEMLIIYKGQQGESHGINLVTPINGYIAVKCSQCGSAIKSKWAAALSEILCSVCGKSCRFVFMSR